MQDLLLMSGDEQQASVGYGLLFMSKNTLYVRVFSVDVFAWRWGDCQLAQSDAGNDASLVSWRTRGTRDVLLHASYDGLEERIEQGDIVFSQNLVRRARRVSINPL